MAESCDETICPKLKRINVKYRLYEPLGGPDQEGWSMLTDVYEEKDGNKLLCYEHIGYCPLCQKRLDKRPDPAAAKTSQAKPRKK